MSPPTLTEMTHEQRCALIQRICRVAYCEADTWESAENNLGAHLAYLAWSISTGDSRSHVKWDMQSHKPVLNLFRKWFPAEDPVWRFIQTKEGQS